MLISAFKAASLPQYTLQARHRSAHGRTDNLGPEVPWDIVGVIADVQQPGDQPSPLMYVPQMQWPQPGGALAVRTDLEARHIDSHEPLKRVERMI